MNAITCNLTHEVACSMITCWAVQGVAGAQELRCACLYSLRHVSRDSTSCRATVAQHMCTYSAAVPHLVVSLFCACACKQSYKQEQQQATNRLADLDRQFEAAVAAILGITPDQHPQLLAAALQEQQQLQEAQVSLPYCRVFVERPVAFCRHYVAFCRLVGGLAGNNMR